MINDCFPTALHPSPPSSPREGRSLSLNHTPDVKQSWCKHRRGRKSPKCPGWTGAHICFSRSAPICLLIPPPQTEVLPHGDITFPAPNGYNIPCFSPQGLPALHLHKHTCLHTHRKLSTGDLRGHFLHKQADFTEASNAARMAPSPASTWLWKGHQHMDERALASLASWKWNATVQRDRRPCHRANPGWARDTLS